MNNDTPLKELLDVIDSLLGPGGCPWDQAQTPETLCDYIIEESFELVDCIRAGDTPGALEEIGDVLFLLLFASRLYEKKGAFTLADVFEAEAAKMIRRHPHVFADLTLKNREELLRNWERIKRAEKKEGAGLYDSLPKGLPPLLKAYRIHSKAARVGFTWESDEDMKHALEKERMEFEMAVAAGDDARMAEEFGDYLFSLAEYGRRLGLKANSCLDDANKKFLGRFRAMEALAKERGLDIATLTLAEWNGLWDEVKRMDAK
jgi:ATP diphosphatase